jgi:hypothetical protein
MQLHMDHASSNCFVGQLIYFWIRKFSTDHAVYILARVWFAIFDKEDENVCMRQPTLLKFNDIVAPLLWPSVGVKPNTWKSWELESSGTPECLELNRKGQDTSHWGVLGVIGKVLKRRYRKCPRINNSDI